ncbi:glutamate synthase large subunit [Clostridium gasigenes]|uniref:Glutamate synthase (Ferredoxin) n=1 Tax=Clostridium gasigenes TaxID=94869 RepID=A0A1H0MG48_9CLOT|nr:glutamate synthase large subunit [Clostridium gasigenes]MBB6622142.1 glutamate synthase large subunit [Clostridium gasigenes]MBU3086981.1 glutamate synthase large subunit [Clostridium gasigenes]SDO79374.1 glutamate synthase (ferredoxin) [Clostridium gasigenes]
MKNNGLYNSSFEHDACGIGAIANIKGIKSHKVIEDCLNILENLEHRGGMGAEDNIGDGAGILFQIPHRFFKEEGQKLGIIIPGEGEYAVGMFFLSTKKIIRDESKTLVEAIVREEGLELLAWRKVPIDKNNLGQGAIDVMPYFLQPIIGKPSNVNKGIDFERKLYLLRRRIEKAVDKNSYLNKDTFYIASLSSKTIVYKGMLLSTQLRSFYIDLKSAKLESAIALVHSRYSTNTFPSWERAHPNRYMIHNGEINTLRGNVNRVYSREAGLVSEVLGDDLQKVLPIINKEGSDSAILDNTLEFLTMNGRDLTRAVMMLVPEPWVKSKSMKPSRKAFYEYNATLMEPWDGPSAIVFTDGEKLGAVLDRNGLRPARYYVTEDGHLILASEVGALDIRNEEIKYKGRLTPGKMLIVDTKTGELIDDEELKEKYESENPYSEWLEDGLVTLDKLPCNEGEVLSLNKENRSRLERVFGYGYEDLKNNILKMAESAEEPLVAMGIDSPIAILSKDSQPLFNYFKQLFAQVTNPPIDAIREEIVTATNVYLGTEGNILNDSKTNCNQIRLDNPIISDEELAKIKGIKRDGFKVKVLKTLFNKNNGKDSLENSLEKLFIEADKAYEEGFNIFILSDREVDEENLPIPSLLALAGLHHHLVKKGMRTRVAIIVESGEPREIHHFATLLGYGACAINPYLAYSAIEELIEVELLDLDYKQGVYNFNKAILKGIVKILSKMGISTVQSYQGAQMFEALGISTEVIDKYFTNTITRIGGIGLSEIQDECLKNHKEAFNKHIVNYDFSLDSLGTDKVRSGKEEHLYNPLVIHKLQEATKNGDYKLFKEYTALLNREESHLNLRGLMEFNYTDYAVSLDEVESVESIVKRFKTGAMSYGSISKEAHEALAIAMNRIGGKSNTGEGGEDALRWIADENGDLRRSSIKQIASGRFGVTSEYLVNADELQIKVAQGAKPGEGGQLPASKVYPWIAKTRKSTAGVGLISPPPHHDIYSIEDLAQLIYDLKNANLKARVSVKLVSETGVGTIAAGVAKGGADVIVISGYDGGTGAAPRTSVKHAGIPWEIGLAEAQQTLIMNGLRERVVLETDGKLMSGRDVAIATLLGAEEFAFATAPLVALGCVMMRVCNLDTCPVGIATQNSELRKRFKGKPEYVVNFMYFVAEELREYMAKLGFRNLDEMVGRIDKLKQKEDLSGSKISKVNLSSIFNESQFEGSKGLRFNKEKKYNHKLDEVIDSTLFLSKAKTALDSGEKVKFEIDITNTNRTLGTILGSEITRIYKSNGLAEDTIRIKCNGAGGQSFGAFIPSGLTLQVEGDSNDYLGKGLSGGKIIVYVPSNCNLVAEENIIIGNVALYGATSGKILINGIAGERFAVRNSGAIAVVEGLGDHGLEYMTGGKIVVLGEVGVNFAAGMSGGIAYVLDEFDTFKNKVNEEMVFVETLEEDDVKSLKCLIEEHVNETKSAKGTRILENFDEVVLRFKKVIPKDYKRMIKILEQKQKEGLEGDVALLAAFVEKTKTNK